MRKRFKLMVALIVAIIALPVLGSSVLAEEDGNDNIDESIIKIDDGYYTISSSYIKKETDESSSMGKYLDDSVFLSVKDGKVDVTITINEDETVTKLQVNGKDAEEAIVDGDKRYETFQLDNIPTTLDAYVEYQAPYQGGIFEGDADFRISFGEATLKEAKATDKPGKGSSDESDQDKDEVDEDNSSNKDDNNDGTDENDNSNKNGSDKKSELIPDKAYKIDYEAKKDGSDEESSAARSMNDAVLLVKNGEQYIQLSLTGWSMIDYLGPVDGDVDIVKENKDSATIQFKINGDLSDVIKLKMAITPPGMEVMKHKADLYLDPDSKQEIDASDYQLADNEDETGENNTNNNGDNKNGTKENDNSNKKDAIKESNLKPDKAYQYDYVVKHETEDEVSAADKFFKKPATVLYKDGEKYIQLTVTNWEWIKSLETANGEVVVVQKNEDGSAVVQFKVDGELSDAITLYMHIIVPKEVAGMDYDMNHEARLFLDLDSKEEVDASNYELTILDNDKPTTNPEAEEVPNPQTGDTSNIWLYVLLLIGSIVPLAIKMKRRFV